MIVKEIKIADIHIDDEFNCRGTLTPIDVEELAKDIGQHGLHQPVVVFEYTEEEQAKYGFRYKLVAGFCRTYAHKVLNKETIFAVIKPHMGPVAQRIVNLQENLKRKDLNPLQEAKAVTPLFKAGLTQKDIATQLGKSRGWVLVRLAILELPEEIKIDIAAGLLNQYQIKKVATYPTKEIQFAAVRKIKNARARGEKTGDILKSRKAINRHDRKARTKTEVEKRLNDIMDSLHENPYSTALAWVLGNLSDAELYGCIRETYPNFTEPVVIPKI